MKVFMLIPIKTTFHKKAAGSLWSGPVAFQQKSGGATSGHPQLIMHSYKRCLTPKTDTIDVKTLTLNLLKHLA